MMNLRICPGFFEMLQGEDGDDQLEDDNYISGSQGWKVLYPAMCINDRCRSAGTTSAMGWGRWELNTSETANMGMRRWLVALSASVYFALLVSMVFFGPATLLEGIHRELGVSISAAAAPLNIYKVCLVFFLPFTGKVVRMLSLRLVLVASAIVVGLAGLACPLVSSIPQLVIINVVFAMGMTFCGLPSLFHIVTSWFPKGGGTASALVLIGWSASGVVTPPILASYTEQYGWRVASFTIAVAYVLVALPLVIFVVRQKTDFTSSSVSLAEGESEHSSNTMQLLAGTASRKFWALGSVYFALSWTLGVIFDHFAVFLTEERGFDLPTAAKFVSLFSAVALCTKLVSGYVGDKIGQTRIMLCGAVIVNGSMVLLLRETGAYSWFVLFSILFGVGYSAVFCTMCNAVPALFGKGGVVAVQSLMMCFMQFGSAMGSAAAGIILNRTSSYHLTFVLTILILTTNVGVVSYLFREEERLREATLEEKELLLP